MLPVARFAAELRDQMFAGADALKRDRRRL
jgi:hypothetical protein